jgi:hypothetical protein
MYYIFCLGCGVKLPSHIGECSICGFDNSFDQDNDMCIDQELLDFIVNDSIFEDDPY